MFTPFLATNRGLAKEETGYHPLCDCHVPCHPSALQDMAACYYVQTIIVCDYYMNREKGVHGIELHGAHSESAHKVGLADK